MTKDKLGEIINSLMDQEPPKKIAFKNSVGRDYVYQLKKRWPLFCGWTNEYGERDA